MKKSGSDAAAVLYKEVRREVQRQLRRAYWGYLTTTFENADPEQAQKFKKFWAYIKHLRSSNVGIGPLKIAGRLEADPAKQAKELNITFQKAFSNGQAYTEEEFKAKCKMPPNSFPPLPEIDVAEEGVVKLLRQLKTAKAPGPDGVTNRILKELADPIAPILTLIFKSSLSSGKLPLDWKDAHVSPIFKKGEQYNPANYRPVSLTSVCCKVMEHIITSHIMTHLEKQNILCPEQHGFRQKRSCETQLLDLTTEIMDNLKKGTMTDILVMDFAKAFDKVNHSLLTHKLYQYGVQGQVLHWITDFLHDRRQAVVIDGVRSDFVSVQSGVPQGSVLGPCLFLVYINDLPDTLTAHARLFADDTAVYDEVKSDSDRAHLQQNLDLLNEWEIKWDMTFHPNKCVQLPVTRMKEPPATQYHLHGHTLDTVDSTDYLGLKLTKNLSWSEHIGKISAKANKTLGFLRRNLKIS